MTSRQSLRSLPSIDSLLKSDDLAPAIAAHGRTAVRDILRTVLDELRAEIKDPAAAVPEIYSEVRRRLSAEVTDRSRLRTQRVINATGVILHTNLGRAPLGQTAISAIIEVAQGYSNLEYDLESGARGRRGSGLEKMLVELLRCEAAVVVNNCAAAVYLTLNALAEGGEVVVSRGELIEIGGSFRLPDVIAKSGARMREVGTTNRTRLSDFRHAINENTRVLLRSHPSNFRIVGFTERPAARDLARLAAESNTVFFEDLGSGALIDLTRFGVPGEPTVQETLASGVDLVAFSGDKLLGGPQAGVIVGRRDLIEKIRSNPLMRAFRVDKLTYAALEATVSSYLKEQLNDIPALEALGRSADEIGGRALSLAMKLKESRVKCEVIDGVSVTGGGTAPQAEIPTKLIMVRVDGLSAADIELKLRKSSPPIIVRIEDDRVLLDLRTVAPDDEPEILAALLSLKSTGDNT